LPAIGAENRLIGSNRQSLEAMAQARPEAQILSTALVGDVADAAEVIVGTAQDAPCPLALFGGETTVTLTGTGLGGRNQDLALRVAIALDGQQGWRFLSAGTDGRDGPTEAAGAIVDGETCARIRAAGGDPLALLANNDSNRALALAGDLLVTGGTGTNVADLQILSLAR
jgi:glycerate 2-kinase